MVSSEKKKVGCSSSSISMAIQRGNTSCVLGTVPRTEGLEEIFEFVTNSTPDVGS